LCGADIDGEIQRLTDKVRDALNAFNILGDGAGVWLGAKEIELDGGEQVLIIFPRSIMDREGPSVSSTSKKIESAKHPCDFILTDRRLILDIGDSTVGTELAHIDSCMTINVGKFIGRRHVLILSFNGDMYRISLPYNARKTKVIMDILTSYIQQVMVK